MSRARSASTGRSYGRARVLRAWGLPRSTFYERRRRPLCPRPPARRGPETRYTDDDLLAEIRHTTQEPPFHGEGHRKVGARLRVRDVRTSMRRVLRLMRENDLLAPQRQPQPVEPKRHDGTLLAERPNQMWGIDATVGFTVDEGRVTTFAMVDHATAECLGIHVAKRGTQFEALEPVRQAVQKQFGGFAENIACGVRLRHDQGAQFMSDDFQSAIRVLGMESSPAFVRQTGRKRLRGALLPHPEGTATLGARLYDAGGAGRGARGIPPMVQRPLAAGKAQVSIPAAGTSEAACPRGCCMTIIQETVQEIGCGIDHVLTTDS